MKYIIILFIVLYLISGSVQLDPTDVLSIQQINTDLQQNWDVSNDNAICVLNSPYISCANNRITYLKLVSPSSSRDITTEVFQLSGLLDLYIDTKLINIPTSFWNDLLLLSNLRVLSLRYVGSPIDLQSHTSLRELQIYECSVPLPEQLFTTNVITSLNIGASNTYDVTNLFPLSISSPSAMEYITVGNFGSFNMDGTNFDNLFRLIINNFGTNQPIFDKFNTYPFLQEITISNSAQTPIYQFPNSISAVSNLKSLNINANLKLGFGATPINFISTLLTTFTFTSIDLSLLPINGLTVPVPCTLFISGSKIEFAKLNILQFGNVDLFTNTYVDSLPTNSFQNISIFSMTSGYSGLIPNSICDVKRSITLTSLTSTSLPDCFKCDWNAGDSGYIQNMPQFNGITQSCPNFRFRPNDYTPGDFPTIGGVMSLSGTLLGWKVYNSMEVAYQMTDPLIGNSLLSFTIPPGTGRNKYIVVKFHAKSDTAAAPNMLSYNYLPPNVTGINPQSDVLTLSGSNFGSNIGLVSLTIAGKNFSCQTSQNPETTIISNANAIPYSSNLTVSVGVIVDGQSFYKIFKPPGAVHKLNLPLPMLYSGGGIIEFPGEYLTYDTTIMNLSINGTSLIPNLTQATSDKLTFAYGVYPIGSYQFEFTLDDYEYISTIEVNSIPPCKVVHGTCMGVKPICDKPYTGPDCSSLPANLTEPLPNSLSISTQPSQPYNFNFNGIESNFTYSILLKSVIEYTPTNEIFKNVSLALTGNMTTTNQPNVNKYAYDTGSFVSNIEWVSKTTQLPYLFSINKEAVESSHTYLIMFTTYLFGSDSNYLEVTYQVEFEMISTNLNETCASVYNGNLPTDKDFDYIQAKINYMDFYSRILRICYIDTFKVCDNVFSYKVVNQDNNKITLEIKSKVPKFSTFAFELDFTMLVEEEGCFNEDSSSQDIPTNDCKGTPMCYGHGKCINHVCECDSGWKGEICDSVDTKIPPITKPNTTNPDIDGETNEIGYHISIYEIKELDFRGNQVRSQKLSKWNYTHAKDKDVESFFYSYKLDKSEILVEVNYFFSEQVVEFAGESSIKSPGSIKYSANITSWPFLKKTNLLQVIFKASARDNTGSDDSCTYKSIEYSNSEKDEISSVSIQVNDRTFTAEFTNLAIVDGKVSVVKNQLIPNSVEDSNSESSVLVGIRTPNFNDFVTIDPDFRLLISYVPPKDKEGSVCSSKDSKKLSKAQIAGIVIGCFVFVAVVAAVAFYYIRFHLKKSKFHNSFQNKLQNIQ